MSFVNAIGVISGFMTIVSFSQDNFGDTSDPGSTIKVAVALDGDNGGTIDAGGDLPDIRVWNDFGDFKAITNDPGTVTDGTVGTVEVDHEQQGVYSLFSANNDAICIAWVTTTWSDAAGGNKFAVSGDYGAECGGTWYESNMWTNTDNSYQPRCFWIDADGDQPNTGFQVRWPRYSSTEFDEAETDPTSMCNDIDFGLRTESDPSSINFWQNAKHRRAQNDRRMRARRQTRVPLEGFFCDMGAKVKYPLCDGASNTTASCFDLESQKLVDESGLQGRDAPSSYSSVRDWRGKTSSV